MGCLLSTIQANYKTVRKGLTMLVYPDKTDGLEELVSVIRYADIDYFILGGSILLKDGFSKTVGFLRNKTDLPVFLFPGNTFQLRKEAQGIIFLTITSARNPDHLIKMQEEAALWIKNSAPEAFSTGYILLEGGNATGVSCVSMTETIPGTQADIAVAIGISGEMMDIDQWYMDACSGTKSYIPFDMMRELPKNVSVPINVGCGIRSPESTSGTLKSGDDIAAVENGAEIDPTVTHEINQAVKKEKWIAG
jgi:putative glycerol-1-phosphate prenyltransferase